MPLLDHFHPPLSVNRRWESLHATWTVCLADALTPMLPEGYFVEVQTHAGTGVEIDVAAFEEGGNGHPGNGTALATPSLRTPTWTFPVPFPPGFEVRVISTASGPTVVGAIELVSPANKDRPETRRAFATKCASYLYQGVSLIVVDVMTERIGNLHNETMGVMDAGDRYRMAEEGLYAVAYRPVRRDGCEAVEAWAETLGVGAALPTLPLVLSPEVTLMVDLEATYSDACTRRKLG